jgi:hypothetical protein
LLARRQELYQRARRANPSRWSGKTRNWTPVGAVTVNPDRDTAGSVACDAGALSSLSNATYLASVKKIDLPALTHPLISAGHKRIGRV